jgi:ferredoxin
MTRNLLDRIISPATRQFIGEAIQADNYSFYDFVHGYVYGRWTYLYISLGIGEHPLAKKFGPLIGRLASLLAPKNVDLDPNGNDGSMRMADTYHGKVVPLESARQLVKIKEEIELPDLEQVIPYQRARAIIMRNPEHIVALECPCRVARSEPCLPLDVCLVVGEPFSSFIMEHSPKRARWISSDEAAEILIQEDARGHVHHAFFKDAMLGRFYAICNCCSCCCGAMQSQRNGNPMLASSGYICQVDEFLCLGCEICTQYCQFEALVLQNGYAHIDMQACLGCGVCIDKCDQGALSLIRSIEKGVPLEIEQLMAQVS